MKKHLTAAAALLCGILVLTGCGGKSADKSGSSDPSSDASADLASYQQVVDDGTAGVTWNGPTDAAKAPSDTSLAIVTCTMALEGCKLLTEGSEHAAKAVGWQSHVVNVTDPTGYDQALQTVIAQGADAVVLVGVDQRLIPGGIKAAHAKKIPLVSLFQNNEPGPDGVDVEVSPDPDQEGKLLASRMIVNNNGKVHVLFMPDDEFSLPVGVLAAAKKTLDGCSACDVKYAKEINFTAATVGTSLPGRVVAALRQDSSINSILVGFDPPVTTVIPALNAAGLKDQAKFYSQLGTTAALGFIADDNVMDSDVGASNEWGGWAAVDQAIRLLNGQPTVDENVPVVLLTKDNLPPSGEPFTGEDAGFKDKYLALWK
jgi:ribose transport system substrate-binding protein